MGDLVGAVSNDLLEISGESGIEGQVQMVKYRGGNERNREGDFNGVGIHGEVIADKRRLKLEGNREADLTSQKLF